MFLHDGWPNGTFLHLFHADWYLFSFVYSKVKGLVDSII